MADGGVAVLGSAQWCGRHVWRGGGKGSVGGGDLQGEQNQQVSVDRLTHEMRTVRSAKLRRTRL